MKRQGILYSLLLLCFYASAQGRSFYVSKDGDDTNNGLSISAAWRTLAPVNNLNLDPGDQVFLEAGQSFSGNIQLDADDLGTTLQPIRISSYGNGMATINAINTAAINGENSGGLRIDHLILNGDGSNHDGIDLMLTQTASDIDYIFIDSVEVSGFGGRGLLIGAYDTDKGFNHVRVEHSIFHNNGVAGMETFGAWPAFSNTDFSIRYCKFYDNTGVLSSPKTTGTGIVVSGVDGGIIEYCEAYNNGAFNRSSGGGPVGIWVYDTKNIIIQYCESHHNKAGLLKDGGGFDIDGGSQNCMVQYCYSHDNEGYGMALVEYGSPNAFTGNIIRYNISQNDGRKNNYGAIALYAVDPSHQVKNSEVYNNTIYANAVDLVNGQPSAIAIESQNFSGVSIRNNIFYVAAGVKMLNSIPPISTTEINFQNNNYFSTTGSYDFSWGGVHFTSLEDWRAAATGQETNGLIQNPLLEDAGTGGNVSPAEGGNFHSLFGYNLNPFSPVVDKAIKIGDVGTHDFFGTALPSSSNYDIGAAQATTSYPLPLTILSFVGTSVNSQVELRWKVSSEEYLVRYEVQRSVNGIDFRTIGSVVPDGKSSYRFNDSQGGSVTVYYRLKYVYPNGKSGTSDRVKVSRKVQKQPHAFYNEGQGAQIDLYCDYSKKVTVWAFSAGGSLISASSHELSEGFNSIIIESALKWQHGVYFIQINDGDNMVQKLVK